jgi:hypothetical protein
MKTRRQIRGGDEKIAAFIAKIDVFMGKMDSLSEIVQSFQRQLVEVQDEQRKGTLMLNEFAKRIHAAEAQTSEQRRSIIEQRKNIEDLEELFGQHDRYIKSIQSQGRAPSK